MARWAWPVMGRTGMSWPQTPPHVSWAIAVAEVSVFAVASHLLSFHFNEASVPSMGLTKGRTQNCRNTLEKLNMGWSRWNCLGSVSKSCGSGILEPPLTLATILLIPAPRHQAWQLFLLPESLYLCISVIISISAWLALPHVSLFKWNITLQKILSTTNYIHFSSWIKNSGSVAFC